MDGQEFKRLIELYSGLVYRVAYCYVRNRADADDIMQDIFLALYTYKKEFSDDERIRAWLIRVTSNRCKNLLNSFRHRMSLPIEAGETEAPITRVYRSHCELISQQDNLLSFYGTMSLSDIGDTLENKTVTLDFGDLYRLIPNESVKDPEPWKDRELLTCGLHVDIPIDFEICTEARELTLNEKIEFHEVQCGYGDNDCSRRGEILQLYAVQLGAVHRAGYL